MSFHLCIKIQLESQSIRWIRHWNVVLRMSQKVNLREPYSCGGSVACWSHPGHCGRGRHWCCSEQLYWSWNPLAASAAAWQASWRMLSWRLETPRTGYLCGKSLVSELPLQITATRKPRYENESSGALENDETGRSLHHKVWQEQAFTSFANTESMRVNRC